jgi:hypothetical protein
MTSSGLRRISADIDQYSRDQEYSGNEDGRIFQHKPLCYVARLLIQLCCNDCQPRTYTVPPDHLPRRCTGTYLPGAGFRALSSVEGAGEVLGPSLDMLLPSGSGRRGAYGRDAPLAGEALRRGMSRGGGAPPSRRCGGTYPERLSGWTSGAASGAGAGEVLVVPSALAFSRSRHPPALTGILGGARV